MTGPHAVQMDAVWLLVGVVFVLLGLVGWLTVRCTRLEFRLAQEQITHAIDRALWRP